MIRENAIGDLLRAFKQLGPVDDASRAAIAEVLGMEWCTDKKTAAPVAEPPALLDEVLKDRETMQEQPKPRWRAGDMPDFPEPGLYPPVLSALPSVAQSERAATQSTWLEEADLLPISGEERRPEARPIEPLLEPVQTRAILTDVLASGVADGPVDVRALRDQICRVEPITELPRLKRRSFGLGIEVLVDRAQALTPFFADQLALLERIRLLVGTEGTCVLRFARSPLLGAGVGGRRTWTPWTPPVPARPILVLTDLGILEVTWLETEEPAAVPTADWTLFARRARDGGCPILALVPYPRSRWPRDVADLFPVLPWDRRLTFKDLRQALGRRWRVTG